MTQEELAERLGTKQPSVARLESGRSNARLTTLVALAEALDATVRIDLEPAEMMLYSHARRWWDREDEPDLVPGGYVVTYYKGLQKVDEEQLSEWDVSEDDLRPMMTTYDRLLKAGPDAANDNLALSA